MEELYAMDLPRGSTLREREREKIDNYAVAKRAAEDRCRWRIMAVNLIVEDGT